MCGIFGWLGDPGEWGLAHRLMVELAIASEQRGVDAAGFAAMTPGGELLWQRQPGPARALFQGEEFRALRRWRIVMAIGHTRLATKGTPAVNGNNHPHLAGDWAVVHNGSIPCHRAAAACLGVPLESECDSEVLAQILSRYGEERGPDICLAVGGKQSVLAINARTRTMLAWTNGEMPLVAFRVEDMPAVWWASTEEIAEKALEAVDLQARFAAPEPGLVYRMEVRGGQVVANRARI